MPSTVCMIFLKVAPIFPVLLCVSAIVWLNREASMKHAPGFLAIVNDAKTRVKELNFREVKSRLDAGEKFTLVDVREDNEWARGHLPGAVHLSKGIIERDIDRKSTRLNSSHP